MGEWKGGREGERAWGEGGRGGMEASWAQKRELGLASGAFGDLRCSRKLNRIARQAPRACRAREGARGRGRERVGA